LEGQIAIRDREQARDKLGEAERTPAPWSKASPRVLSGAQRRTRKKTIRDREEAFDKLGEAERTRALWSRPSTRVLSEARRRTKN